MFQDISLSTTLADEYKRYYENKRLTDIVDFSVMVLSSNSWPFSAPTSFNLPNEVIFLLKELILNFRFGDFS